MSERQAVLDRRVRWLDRRRRAVATVVGMLAAGFITVEAASAMDEAWPQPHIMALATVVGMMVWLVVEVGLAWVTALWHAEHDRLLAGRGLPRAALHTRRRFFGR